MALVRPSAPSTMEQVAAPWLYITRTDTAKCTSASWLWTAGREMIAVETDENTVVSGTLVKAD